MNHQHLTHFEVLYYSENRQMTLSETIFFPFSMGCFHLTEIYCKYIYIYIRLISVSEVFFFWGQLLGQIQQYISCHTGHARHIGSNINYLMPSWMPLTNILNHNVSFSQKVESLLGQHALRLDLYQPSNLISI